MKKMMFGITLFIGGVLGIGAVLISAGASRAGTSFYINDALTTWLAIFSVLGLIGLWTCFFEAYAHKPNETKQHRDF